jgi:hydroxymethylpyrimidine pyrophosphatase-like HAD family hydrolase
MDVESTIAFGDAKIDIPMFEYCHIGVAMGNSSAGTFIIFRLIAM